MDKNLFRVYAATDVPVNTDDLESGYILIDCNAENAYTRVSTDTPVHDDTNDRDIENSEFVYLPRFPSDCITYEQVVSYGKEKYYWDALHQYLYLFIVSDTVEPFTVPSNQEISGVEGNPALIIATSGEFSQLQGEWTEVELDETPSTYTEIAGHPSLYAPMPYLEDTYYYDYTHGLWYTFTSYYTLNINKWYYDKTALTTSLLKYDYDLRAWTTVGSCINIAGNPNEIITVVDTDDDIGEIDLTGTEPISTNTTVDIDNIDQEVYYTDTLTDTLYTFDFGQYFSQVSFTGTVYERAFNFYRELQDVFAKVNDSDIVTTKDLYYVHKHPSKSITEPDEDRIYYDSYYQKYYRYVDEDWVEIQQLNVFVPQSLFPYSHGKVVKSIN